MRKLFIGLLVAAAVAGFALCLSACASSAPTTAEDVQNDLVQEAEQQGKHIIGVAVYNVSDNEVIMFREYLVEYIAGECFDDVQFVYSDSLTSSEEAEAFIDEIAQMGGEGVMSFYCSDLPAEVERCASHGMYHIAASGTVSDEEFAKVADNEYFLGTVGPGKDMEYQLGYDMAASFAEDDAGDSFFIMSGGGSMGNDMHLIRTIGMLDALAKAYGADLGDTEALASSETVETVSSGDLTVTVAPGYVARDEMRAQVKDAYAAGTYDHVMSALPIAPVSDMFGSGVIVGQIDCYSQDNELLFQKGKLHYVAGKYGSIVGPSFAAMYNAITGHAADFRDNGKAFRLTQEMWSSDSEADFNKKYQVASNIVTPAYNYEDLQSVCKEFNSDATLDDLARLAEASSYEDGLARRSE